MFADVLDGEVYKYYADGEWRASASGKTVAIVNPTTRQTQYRVQGAALDACSSSSLFFQATRTQHALAASSVTGCVSRVCPPGLRLLCSAA